MQQAGDRLILAAAVFDNQRGHAEEVRNVRNGRSFPHLIGGQFLGVHQRFSEARAQHRKLFCRWH